MKTEKKCWICGEKATKLFITTKGAKHYYCNRCHKECIIKLPKKMEKENE